MASRVGFNTKLGSQFFLHMYFPMTQFLDPQNPSNILQYFLRGIPSGKSPPGMLSRGLRDRPKWLIPEVVRTPCLTENHYNALVEWGIELGLDQHPPIIIIKITPISLCRHFNNHAQTIIRPPRPASEAVLLSTIHL